MNTIERNDVDINKLFHWGSKFNIVDKYGSTLAEVYIRVVGDAEINRARIYAIRKSAEVRKLLKTEDTDERVAFISGIYELDATEDIINYICILSTKKFTQEALKEVSMPEPKEPKSTADLEEFEKYQKEVDEFPNKKMLAISEYVAKLLENLKNSLKDKDTLYLHKYYERLMIDEICEQTMVEAFKDMCVYLGTYSDENYKEKYFTDIENFLNLPTEIKNQFTTNYNLLEISVDELKKSLEATQ